MKHPLASFMTKAPWMALIVVLVGASPASAVSPEWAAAGSFLLPGVGQAANGEWGAGFLHLSSAFVLGRQYGILLEEEDYIEPEDREDKEQNYILTNRTTFESDLYGTALLNLSFYSAFSAYRDARLDPENDGYSTPPPEETLSDLVAAPFSFEYLSRPGTFLPLLLPLYLALSEPGQDQLVYEPLGTLTREEMAAGFFFQHQAVAIGEETFFRGVLNNGFSSAFGEGLGLLTSSAIFGLGHQGSAGQATSGGAFLFGLYLGWLHQSNEYQLGQGVAIHYWWNFLVSMALIQERKEAQVQLVNLEWRF